MGSFIFLTHTRPKLAFPLSVVNRYMATRQIGHLTIAKHIHCYVVGIFDHGIFFPHNIDPTLVCYVDVGWG
jgi:hypothetical protein